MKRWLAVLVIVGLVFGALVYAKLFYSNEMLTGGLVPAGDSYCLGSTGLIPCSMRVIYVGWGRAIPETVYIDTLPCDSLSVDDTDLEAIQELVGMWEEISNPK